VVFYVLCFFFIFFSRSLSLVSIDVYELLHFFTITWYDLRKNVVIYGVPCNNLIFFQWERYMALIVLSRAHSCSGYYTCANDFMMPMSSS
jgi:hypothetical protein